MYLVHQSFTFKLASVALWSKSVSPSIRLVSSCKANEAAQEARGLKILGAEVELEVNPLIRLGSSKTKEVVQ